MIVQTRNRLGVATSGTAWIGAEPPADSKALPLLALAPALRPEQLGDPGFREAHGVRYAYVAGEMANAIASEKMVAAMARNGMIGYFGSAGLSPTEVEAAITRLQRELGNLPYGFNLIHSPNEPALEAGVVDLYLKRQVHRIGAAAYMALTLPIVRYRVSGIRRNAEGLIITPNHIAAKVSRTEVATRFMSPPPEDMLRTLVSQRHITAEQAEMAAAVPMADDVTAEADSGGHTDNRAAITLLPTMLALRDELQERYGYANRVRVGLGGGIATPASAAAAFAMGAAYVLTGTINQACVESGTSKVVREMLAHAGQADVTMAPAADMFEMGVKVQVLKWGTMFPVRARKLYDLYTAYESIDAIPEKQLQTLERDFFKAPIGEVWASTVKFFSERDPQQIARAERDPKYKMALIFRAYLGQSSRWAIAGDPVRKSDYQVWCGPAIGAFNEWTRGSFLEAPERRDVVTVAMNLLTGAAALTRASWLRFQGVPLPAEAERFAPREPAELESLLE